MAKRSIQMERQREGCRAHNKAVEVKATKVREKRFGAIRKALARYL